MNLQLNPDQQALSQAMDKLAERFASKPTDFHGFALEGHELEQELTAGEYFDIAAIDELGPVSAALAVMRLARVPYTVECALSMLVRPQLPGDWPRPLALIENGRPARHLQHANTLLIMNDERIGIASAAGQTSEPVESLFAYPMARLASVPQPSWFTDADAAKIKRWLRVALAAEASGLMQATVDSSIEYLSARKQFGRPLGSFQALRHRMAECAVLAGGVRWLTLKAAWSGTDADAALAAAHAQESAIRIVYDAHQMLGAMGVTLEHPLHLWTYRLKALVSELGGRGGQACAVAEHCFASD